MDAAERQLLEDLEAEQADLAALLESLEEAAWALPTPSVGWDVKDQVSHLADTEAIARDTVAGGPRSLAAEIERFDRQWSRFRADSDVTRLSREGGLLDMGVEHGIVRKSGAWYTYEGDQLGQGKENSRNFLRDNPDLADEIEKRIKEKLGVGATLDQDDVEPAPTDF